MVYAGSVYTSRNSRNRDWHAISLTTHFSLLRSVAAAGPVVLRGRYRVFASSRMEYPERVVRLMRESLVIDMLNQFLYRFDQKEPERKVAHGAGGVHAGRF